MKKLLIFFIVLTGTLTTFAQTARDTLPKGKADTATETVYICGMHPEVISDQPGNCPKCGMELLAKTVKVKAPIYTCPMHPNVLSDKPGKCPQCGMGLVRKKENNRKDSTMKGMKMDKMKH